MLTYAVVCCRMLTYADVCWLCHRYKSPQPFDDMYIHPLEAVGSYLILYRYLIYLFYWYNSTCYVMLYSRAFVFRLRCRMLTYTDEGRSMLTYASHNLQSRVRLPITLDWICFVYVYYGYLRRARSLRHPGAGVNPKFTCFISTKVQILTLMRLHPKFTCTTNTEVQILTLMRLAGGDLRRVQYCGPRHAPSLLRLQLRLPLCLDGPLARHIHRHLLPPSLQP